MSRFKKIFVIIACSICVLVSSFLIVTNAVKSNVSIAIGKPYSVVVFDHTLAGTEIKDESKIAKINDGLKDTTNVSVFSKLVNGFTLSKRIYQDSDKSFSKWSTDLLKNNLVIEIIYNSMQDLVVYDGSDSRVVSYYCLAFVIPEEKDFTEIPVYYSFTQEASEKHASYAECTPLILCGEAAEFSEFIKGLYD